MLIRLAMKLSENSPAFKKFLWRRWYQYLAGYQIADWRFMNYGFCDVESGKSLLDLQSTDEPNRFAIELYHRIASAINLQGLDVLEVGSGRGGGASFLQRYHRPKSFTGVDLSPKAVKFCRKNYCLEGLAFATGDAESLPFPKDSFDAVINVESSHCYRSIPAFLSEVQRVLRPNGHLLFADLRSAADVEPLHRHFNESGLEILEREDITPNVLAALQRDSLSKQALIEQSISPWIRHTFREFAAIEGSDIYRGFRDGEVVYQRYLLQKPVKQT